MLFDTILVLVEQQQGLHELCIAKCLSNQEVVHWLVEVSLEIEVLLANRCSIRQRLPDKWTGSKALK